MPRTRSRISLRAALASSWASATSALPPSGSVVEALPGGAEVHGQGDEALLGAVVQVALDAAALGLGGSRRRRPARSRPAATWATSSVSGAGPSSQRARATSMRPATSVTHGAMATRPTSADERRRRGRPAPARRRTGRTGRCRRAGAETYSGQARAWRATAPTSPRRWRTSGRRPAAAAGSTPISFHRGFEAQPGLEPRPDRALRQRRNRIGQFDVEQGGIAAALDLADARGMRGTATRPPGSPAGG